MAAFHHAVQRWLDALYAFGDRMSLCMLPNSGLHKLGES